MTEQQREGAEGHPNGFSDTINILDYLEAIIARKKSILVSTVLAFIISTAVSFTLPKTYSATAKILPPQPDQSFMSMMMGQVGGVAGLAGDLLGKGSSADVYVSILKTDAVSDVIIDRFNLMQVYEQKYRLDTYQKLAANVEIAAGKKDGIISIKVEDRDPTRAAQMANAYVAELGRKSVGLSTSSAAANREFLEGRLAQAKAELAKAEDALKAFQARSGMVAVTEQTEAAVEGIAQLKGQLVAQEAQLAMLRRQFTDEAAEVKRATAVISDLRRQLSGLEGGGTGAIPGVGAVPELGQQYLRLMREFKIQETLVELLTKQYEVVKLNEAKEVDGVQLIQQARVPDKKSSPKRSVIILAATCAAFLAAVAYALLREAGGRASAEERQRWSRIKGRLFTLGGS